MIHLGMCRGQAMARHDKSVEGGEITWIRWFGDWQKYNSFLRGTNPDQANSRCFAPLKSDGKNLEAEGVVERRDEKGSARWRLTGQHAAERPLRGSGKSWGRMIPFYGMRTRLCSD